MEITKIFLTRLREIDANLDAVFDDFDDCIQVFARRSGGKLVLEDSFKRKYAESYPELQRRTLHELRDRDIWKRFKSPEEFDDCLFKKQEEAEAKKKRELDSDDDRWMKENKTKIKAAFWNAQHGRFNPRDAKPMEVPRESMYIPKKVKEKK